MSAAPIGSFCWPERCTVDLDRTCAFFADLFGWTFEDVPSAGGAYRLAHLGGAQVAGLLRLPQGPPRWNSYVRVAEADAAAALAQALGGRLTAGPFDVPGIGRMAFIEDPGGAALGLWQAGAHPGATRFDAPGSLAWTELTTSAAEAATAFHAALFGWAPRPRTDLPRPYVEFLCGDRPVGGLLPSERPRSAWLPYFGAPDPAATLARAEALGGRVVVPATELPAVGTFALLADPEGVKVGLLGLSPGPGRR